MWYQTSLYKTQQPILCFFRFQLRSNCIFPCFSVQSSLRQKSSDRLWSSRLPPPSRCNGGISIYSTQQLFPYFRRFSHRICTLYKSRFVRQLRRGNFGRVLSIYFIPVRSHRSSSPSRSHGSILHCWHSPRLPTRSSILLARIPVTRIEERASMPPRLATLARLFQQLKQSNPRPILSTAHYTTELETPSSINRRVLLPRSSAVEARHASLDPRPGRGLEALKYFPHWTELLLYCWIGLI